MYMQVILVTRGVVSSAAGKVKLVLCLCWLILAKSQSKLHYNCLSVDVLASSTFMDSWTDFSLSWLLNSFFKQRPFDKIMSLKCFRWISYIIIFKHSIPVTHTHTHTRNKLHLSFRLLREAISFFVMHLQNADFSMLNHIVHSLTTLFQEVICSGTHVTSTPELTNYSCIYFCLSQLLWSPKFLSTNLQTKSYHSLSSVIHKHILWQISVSIPPNSSSWNFVTNLTFRFGYPTIIISCKHAPLPLQTCTCSFSYN
jgi:hypothetical protein